MKKVKFYFLEVYFLEVHVQYLEKLHELHSDLPFCLKE